jgi:hypothetical protein
MPKAVRNAPSLPDVSVERPGGSTFFLFHLHSRRAQSWVKKHCEAPLYYGEGIIAVDHRFAEMLVAGMMEHALRVS